MGEKECEKVFAAASKKITPSLKEARAEKKFAAWASKKLEGRLPKDAEVHFVGSAARDTGISGDKDIDLFASFSKERGRDEIVELTKRAAKELHGSWQMHYAEHPYLQAVIKGFKVEVIPCYRISENEQLASAVDRTPLHALYLQKRLSARQKRDVRLLKQLLKANGLYGAEAEVEGFSGLVCEYLVLDYRSLYNLLQNAAKWTPPVLLDIENAYEGNEEMLKAKFRHHLVLVDFVDKNRNAAAAVSERNFSRFILLARAFLGNPSLKLFFPPTKKIPKTEFAAALKSRLDFVVVELEKPKGLVDDILIPQLRRTQHSIAKHLRLQGFRLFDSCSFCGAGACYLVFELDGLHSPRLKKVFGPPAFMEKDAKRFLSSHKNASRGPFVEGGRLAVEEFGGKAASQFFEEVKRNPGKFGAASHLLKPLAKSRVFVGESVLKQALTNHELFEGLCAYVYRKEPFL